MREIHFGRVVDNDDPLKRGGLKVRVDTLIDNLPLTETHIPPSFPFAGNAVGFFFVPAVGAEVEVEVEAGLDAGAENLDARWRATLYSNLDDVPSEFKSDYPNRGGIKFGPVVVTFDQTQDLLALVASNVRLGIEGATHPVLRGDTYNTEESTLLTAIKAYLDTIAARVSDGNSLLTKVAADMSALSSLSIPSTPFSLPPLTATSAAAATASATAENAAAVGASTAVTTFLGKALTWLSTRVKTE